MDEKADISGLRASGNRQVGEESQGTEGAEGTVDKAGAADDHAFLQVKRKERID